MAWLRIGILADRVLAKLEKDAADQLDRGATSGQPLVALNGKGSETGAQHLNGEKRGQLTGEFAGPSHREGGQEDRCSETRSIHHTMRQEVRISMTVSTRYEAVTIMQMGTEAYWRRETVTREFHAATFAASI